MKSNVISRVFSLFLFTALEPLVARPVQVTLWISGGSHGILAAGRQAPGTLGVAARVGESPTPSFWIDVGGSGDFAGLPGHFLPDAAVPGGEALRAGGFSLLQGKSIPWTAINVDILPQYPDAEVPVPSTLLLESPEGAHVRVVGLLADDTPLRVPPQLLRPLRILSPEETLREHLPALRDAPGELLVLVLPEGGDPREWSRMFPDIPLMVEPAAAPAAIVPLDEGRRLRVRPAPHGRAVVRVDLVWDTVARRFAAPDAEIVWVRPASVDLRALPDSFVRRLRPISAPPDTESWPESKVEDHLSRALLEASSSDAVLLPARRRSPVEIPTLPESWRASWVPVDDSWLRVGVDGETARMLFNHPVDGAKWIGRVSGSGTRNLLLPTEWAAGAGGAARDLRRVLDDPEARVDLMPFSTRDLLPPTVPDEGAGP